MEGKGRLRVGMVAGVGDIDQTQIWDGDLGKNGL